MKECKFEQLIGELPIGSAYVPWQVFDRIYENLEVAYQNGTIFPELDMPFEGRRCKG